MSEINILSSHERKKVIRKWLSVCMYFAVLRPEASIKSTRPVQTCTKPVFKICVRG